MPRDLGQRAQEFREKCFAPSGGWLSELTILLANVTGVWDIIILAGIFVGSWIVIRTSPMEIAMILALGFDLVIPLQYHNNEYLARKHSAHLQNYWPVLLMGCLVEGMCFFLLHPDLFTLVVCVKTSALTVVWLSRDQKGLPIKISKSGRSSGGSSGGGRGSSDGGRSESKPSSSKRESSRKDPKKDAQSSQSSSSKPKSSKASKSSSSKPSYKSSKPDKAPKSDKPSKPSSSSSTPPSNMPTSRHIPDAYKYLHRAGYSDPAIAGMIQALNGTDKDSAKKNMKLWAKEKNKDEVKRRNEQYARRAAAAGWPGKTGGSGSGSGASGGSGSGGGSGGKTKLAVPEESIKKAEALMKKQNVPSEERKKVLKLLKDPKSEKEIQAGADILKKMGIPVKTSGSSSSSSSSSSASSGAKLGEPDGKGLYRDIVLEKDVVEQILKGVARGGMPRPQRKQWEGFLTRPLSRGELERKVIPLAKSMHIYLGGGLHGGGPHGLDTKRLKKMQPALRERCGVDAGMADHMILVAVNQKSSKEAQAMINRWMDDGLSRKEFEQLRKTGPDWA